MAALLTPTRVDLPAVAVAVVATAAAVSSASSS